MISVRTILIALASMTFLASGFIASTVPHPPLLAVLGSMLPIGAIVLTAAWKSPARTYLVPLFLVGVLLIAFNIERLREHAAWINFAQHFGAMILLGLTFGSTLAGNHAEALISRIAAFMIPESLDETFFRYTWKVTLAWTVYFAVGAVLSPLLFFLAPIKVWSVFADILTPVTLGLMFVVEYLVRRRALPDGPNPSIAGTIQAYRRFNQRQP